jgi:hypothetical protein
VRALELLDPPCEHSACWPTIELRMSGVPRGVDSLMVTIFVHKPKAEGCSPPPSSKKDIVTPKKARQRPTLR